VSLFPRFFCSFILCLSFTPIVMAFLWLL
jgi:hypothetical protein